MIEQDRNLDFAEVFVLQLHKKSSAASCNHFIFSTKAFYAPLVALYLKQYIANVARRRLIAVRNKEVVCSAVEAAAGLKFAIGDRE